MPSGSFTQVSAGDLHWCGLRSDGLVTCWGDKGEGKTPGGSFTHVSVCGLHWCGLRADGSVTCWGRLSVVLPAVGGVGLPPPVSGQTAPGFEDVPEGHVAEASIEWAVKKGINVGVGNNLFGVGQTLTRYQAVTFLCRAFNSGNCASGARGSDRFVDVPPDHWANDAVGWAADRGITSGVSATQFGGIQTLTREQMITFLHRARGSPSGSSKGSDLYWDVPEDRSQWANLPIGWAFDQGVTGVIAERTFGFGTNLSREEMVLFLCREIAPETCHPSQNPLPSSVAPTTTTP